jgi:serine/threonine-protein kinase
MSVVRGAVDTRDGSFLAVKTLPPSMTEDPWRVGSLRKEYHLARRFRHPNIVRFVDYLENVKTPYLFMEYIPGSNLRWHLENDALSIQEKIEIAKAVAGALHHIHHAGPAGLVHGDVKPENILIREGDRPFTRDRVVLIDFGTLLAPRSRIPGATWLRETAWKLLGGKRMIGCSPFYMSPEQANVEGIDHRSDLYSLGAVLYELFTGRPPFLPSTEEERRKSKERAHPIPPPDELKQSYREELMLLHRTEPVVLPSARNPKVPGAIEKIILRCLQKEAADRFPTALDLHQALMNVRLEFQQDAPWMDPAST